MKVQCQLCNHYVKLDDYDKHYERCSSIKYIQKRMKELYNQEIKYNDLYRLDKIAFEKKYFWALNRIYDKTEDKKEVRRLENILYGANYNLKDCV